MKKHEKILVTTLLVGALLWVGGFVAGWYVNGRINDTAPVASNVSAVAKATFSADGKEVSYDGQNDKTALEVLKSLTTVDTKDSAYGTMVTGVHGVKAEDSKSYWAFYVNGSYASEGAGTFKTKSTDKVTWKLEEIR